jgi:hypothetical protein
MPDNQEKSPWQEKHILKVRENREPKEIQSPEPEQLRKDIEPWLTALFQSEHLSILMGAGISSAAHWLAMNKPSAGMSKIEFSVFQDQNIKAADESAKRAGRGMSNIEDQIRVANELIKGLEIYLHADVYGSKKLGKELGTFKAELNNELKRFANTILENERNITSSEGTENASEYLMSFLVSFASRSATRERLNIFTTNYDRIIEYGAELAGIRLIDRFVGTLNPIFRSSRVEVDMHYNPPGIRGEPRYLEGVAHFTKLHGSLDWIFQNDYVRRIALPYGAVNISIYTEGVENLMIYPNSAKDRETSEYPYVELFRDLAAAVCRPNSTLVIYGYSFGDEHINRVIADMMTIPSTHLVIISFSDEGDRIKRFYEKLKRPAQISLLIGNHFGDLKILVDHYLPKPAIDKTTFRMAELLKARGYNMQSSSNNDEGVEK